MKDNLKQISEVYLKLRKKYFQFDEYIKLRSIKKTLIDEAFDFQGLYWDIISEYISYLVSIRFELDLAKAFMSDLVIISQEIEYNSFQEVFEIIRLMPNKKQDFLKILPKIILEYKTKYYDSLYKNGQFWITEETNSDYWATIS